MSKSFWNEFIQIYKENPCLWDKKCADYKNDLKNNKAYELLTEKMRELNIDADKETVQMKIDSLKRDYEIEKARISKMEKTEKMVVPSWEYYSSLKFIDSDEEDRAETESTVKDVNFDEDDCSAFAAYLKTRMRKLNPTQKSIAEKLMSDVMFFAETNQLQLTSSIGNRNQS